MSEAVELLAWLGTVGVGYAGGRGAVWLWSMKKAPAKTDADF